MNITDEQVIREMERVDRIREIIIDVNPRISQDDVDEASELIYQYVSTAMYLWIWQDHQPEEAAE